MKSGIQLITEERNRQIFKLNYTVDNDCGYINNELSLYAIQHILRFNPFDDPHQPPDEIKANELQKRIVDLTQAGALMAAEIDRIQAIVKTQGLEKDQ